MNNNFKIIIRNLLNNPTFGLITIGGFAFSLAIALLLSSYLFNEMTYDKSMPDADRVYRLCTDRGIATFRGDLAQEIKDSYPEIEKVCRYDKSSSDIIYNKTPYSIDNFINTDPEFFRLFSVKLKYGNINETLPDSYSMAISSSLAKSIFGDINPIGETINLNHQKDFLITAVFEDLPKKSSLQAQVITKWENGNAYGGMSINGVYHSRFFFLLHGNDNIQKLEKELTDRYSQDHYMKRPFVLLPFKSSYMSPLTMGSVSQTLHADLNSILLFSIVTILILVVSVLNFIILFTSNHLTRLKEIGIKKVTGAGRKEVFMQFIFESVIVSFLAFILAIGLSNLLKIPFISLIQKDFPVFAALTFPNIVFVLAGVLIVGFLAGFYPAVIISKYKPVSVFSSATQKGNLRIKSGLSVVQYAISIVLIVSLVVMTRQNTLLKNKDIGFTKEQLILVKIPSEIMDKLPLIKENLLRNPLIKSCTASQGIPGSIHLYGVWSDAQKKYEYQGNTPYLTVDPDFFKVYNAEFIKGRGFEQSDWERSVVINETAFKLTGWESIDGKILEDIPSGNSNSGSESDAKNTSLKVVGVIRDINVEKLNNKVAPTVFECSDHFGISYLTCSVLPGDYPQVIKDIQNVWNKTCPDFVFDYQFYDSWLDSLYKEERHATFIIRVFSILSIILSCLGTFGVIHFVSRQRVKEIGIRKVNGAKIIDIVRILNWNAIRWIFVAFIVATPLSYFIMSMYLRDYAYKTELSWWIFALAGLLALVIALLTVSWQSWKAATRNPVEALRYE